MAVMQYYQLVNNYIVEVTPITPYQEPKKSPSACFTIDDAKDITLAEFDPSTRGLITAHRLKDYRRRNFTLIMLPDIHLGIDYLLEEVGDLGELL